MSSGSFPSRGAPQSRKSRLEKPRARRRNTSRAPNSACTDASANRKPLARCPSTSTGSLTPRNASSPMAQSWLIRWTSRRRRLASKPTRRKAGKLSSRLPMPKSRVSLIVVSVRRARPSLWYLLDPGMLVVDVQRRRHPFGEHPRPEPARGPLGDAPLEDQLHLVRPSQVEVLADHLLEEDTAGERPVQDLGQ